MTQVRSAAALPAAASTATASATTVAATTATVAATGCTAASVAAVRASAVPGVSATVATVPLTVVTRGGVGAGGGSGRRRNVRPGRPHRGGARHVADREQHHGDQCHRRGQHNVEQPAIERGKEQCPTSADMRADLIADRQVP
jgi:hypothetical protein